MSYLLLLLFLFSCTLQISVTLKYSNLINIGSETKATKGLVYELPDTPENPEKNNFDYFEEDNNDETVKDFGFGHGYFLNQVANIYKAQLLLIKHYRNYMESHVVDHMYLSLRVMKI